MLKPVGVVSLLVVVGMSLGIGSVDAADVEAPQASRKVDSTGRAVFLFMDFPCTDWSTIRTKLSLIAGMSPIPSTLTNRY